MELDMLDLEIGTRVLFKRDITDYISEDGESFERPLAQEGQSGVVIGDALLATWHSFDYEVENEWGRLYVKKSDIHVLDQE